MPQTTTDEIEIRRTAAVAILRRLKRERGAAIVDGRKFDQARIDAAEAEIAALDDARDEAAARDAATATATSRADNQRRLDAMIGERSRYGAALDRAEKAARNLGKALREAMDAKEAEHGLALELDFALSGTHNAVEASLTPVNVGNRLVALLRGVLRHELRMTWLGTEINLGTHPEDPSHDQRWSEAEDRHGNMVEYFRRRLPAA
jgi:hypothetical protein